MLRRLLGRGPVIGRWGLGCSGWSMGGEKRLATCLASSGGDGFAWSHNDSARYAFRETLTPGQNA
jgi:hypothetical protein